MIFSKSLLTEAFLLRHRYSQRFHDTRRTLHMSDAVMRSRLRISHKRKRCVVAVCHVSLMLLRQESSRTNCSFSFFCATCMVPGSQVVQCSFSTNEDGSMELEPEATCVSIGQYNTEHDENAVEPDPAVVSPRGQSRQVGRSTRSCMECLVTVTSVCSLCTLPLDTARSRRCR